MKPTNADYLRSLSNELLHATLAGLMGFKTEKEIEALKEWLQKEWIKDEWKTTRDNLSIEELYNILSAL